MRRNIVWGLLVARCPGIRQNNHSLSVRYGPCSLIAADLIYRGTLRELHLRRPSYGRLTWIFLCHTLLKSTRGIDLVHPSSCLPIISTSTLKSRQSHPGIHKCISSDYFRHSLCSDGIYPPYGQYEWLLITYVFIRDYLQSDSI